MTALDNPTIEAVRGEIGDTGADFLIPRDVLQRMYDRAVSAFTAADDRLAALKVYALRWMVGYYARAVTAKDQDERLYNNKLWEHYKAMLDTAEIQAGMSGGKIQVGAVALGQDFTTADFESTSFWTDDWWN